MAIFKCKMCGGSLELQQGNSIVECPYCGTMQTVPTLDEKLIRLYNRANQYRLDSEFDKAYSAYESIISEKNDEAEAYWGMVLSEFGVEYVEDPETKKRIPTCHRTLIKSISSNENYKSALKFADLNSKTLYEDEAEVIDSLQKKILNASAKEDPYDVFICYKETDADGNRTEDSVLAQEIYESLTSKGYRAFFSRITLEDKLGKDYEPCIYAALTSAKVMLVVTTDTENCNSVWVKNEWKRYIDFMKTDKDKTLIPVYKNMSPYALPDEFAKLQAQDMSKIGALQDLVRGVEKLIGKNEDAKSGLSESEKKLLDAFEKSQAKKKSLIKNVISFAVSAALVIAALIVTIITGDIDRVLDIAVLDSPDGSYKLSWVFASAPVFLGIVWFLGTFFTLFLRGKKSFKFMQYSYTLLFALFTGYIILCGLAADYVPATLLWIAYILVGATATLTTVISTVINKKIPFMLAVIIACVVCLSGYELSAFDIKIADAMAEAFAKDSNERDTSVEQIRVISDFINVIATMDENGVKVGVVHEGDIYTVLDSEIVEGTKWIQIQTGTGINGYIEFAKDGEQYCKYLPADKELQKELDAQRVKEEAEIKAAEDAVKALDGMWHWNGFYGYYVEFQNGALSYGTNAEKSDSSKEKWHKDVGTVVYDTKTKTYVIKGFIWAEKLTLDGGKIRLYDEDGELASFFDGYGTRVKN